MDMRRFFSIITLSAVVSLVFNLGGFGMAHEAMAAGTPHMADDIVGMHTLAMADGPSIDAPLPACGMDFLCYLECQNSRTASISELRNAPQSGKALVALVSDALAAVRPKQLLDTIQTSFSPPDDPRYLLSILKRE